MKKRILATLVAMVMAGTLIGCGNGDEAGAGTENTSVYESTPSGVEATQSSESLESSKTEESEKTEPVEEGSTESEASGESEEGTESSDVGAAETDDMVHGILLSYLTGEYYVVACVDPESGSFKKITSFRYFMNPTSEGYYSPIVHKYTCNAQEDISPDATKFAMDKFLSNGGVHVGWMKTDGSYFDLTEALGEQSQSDFDVKCYRAYGFTPDNRFVYYDESTPDEVFYVYADNPTVKFNGNPMLEFYFEGFDNVAVRLDDVTYLDGGVRKHTIDTYDLSIYEEIIPGDGTRSNRYPVLSPDGSKIAFLSSAKTTLPYMLYIMPLAGGDPQKVELDSVAAEYVSFSSLIRWQ